MEFEDEPMDISETVLDTCYEEGEINSSDEEKDAPQKKQPCVPSIFSRVNKKEKDIVTEFGEVDSDEAIKKLLRAKRFSLPVKASSIEEVSEEQMTSLHRDLGIDKENERHYRLNVIHMRGTENMSTEDVLEYFASYSPSHVEWINDVSCNVVWLDDISTARALLNMSKKIKNLDKIHLNANPFEKELKEDHLETEELGDDNSVDARDITAAIPPGFWRIGVSSEKSPFILLRYATRSDKKQKNAEKNSQYYKKYGNPNFGNIPGILSKSLRNEFKKSKYNTKDFLRRNSYVSNKQSIEKKNPWEELAMEWGKTDKVENNYYKGKTSLKRERIMLKEDIYDLRISLQNRKESGKRIKVSSSESSSLSSDNEIWEARKKIPRMKMYADDEEKKLEKFVGKKIHSNLISKKPVEDLRSKINRKKNRPRLKFRAEKNEEDGSNSKSSDSENECEGNVNWALENYQDLRLSLEHNKQHNQPKYSARKYKDIDVGNNDEDDDDESDMFHKLLGRRSPLQIEIDNDEYYKKKKINK